MDAIEINKNVMEEYNKNNEDKVNKDTKVAETSTNEFMLKVN